MSPSLSDALLQNDLTKNLEVILQKALKDVELIGELDITEEAFYHCCIVMRSLLADPLRVNPFKSVILDFPALLIVSMVFSARYNYDEDRSFWAPYAQNVWGLPNDNRFYIRMRNYYRRAKSKLIREFGFQFPSRDDTNDIVRPIYWHAIIPAYLQNDFARWLKDRIETLNRYTLAQRSDFINEKGTTRYLAPRLRNFLTNSETHETALVLIDELLIAYRMYSNDEDTSDRIHQRFVSLIQREVWQKFMQELNHTRNEKIRTITPPNLQWVWSMEESEWQLRLTNLITSIDEQPRWCVWSIEEVTHALRKNRQRQELWAERQDVLGTWRVREVIFDATDQTFEESFGIVYVYTAKGECIGEPLAVPKLPTDREIIYRLTQQAQYAIPIGLEQITSGRYLVSHNGRFRAIDNQKQPIAPQERYSCSKIMREIVGHHTLEAYNFVLPLTLELAGESHAIEPTRGRYLPSPHLESDYQVSGTSPTFPPVFTDTQIRLTFPNVDSINSFRMLRLHIRSSQINRIEDLNEYGVQIRGDFVIDLSELLIEGVIDTYMIDVIYGFKSRLDRPLELSVVPNTIFEWQDSDLFNPLHPPQLSIYNLNATVHVPAQIATVQLNSEYTHIQWHHLAEAECRIDIHSDTTIVPIAWQVDRLYAWVTEKDSQFTSIPQIITEENLQDVHIHLVGKPHQILWMMIGEVPYSVTLNAKGKEHLAVKYDNIYDVFRDVFRSQKHKVVPLMLQLPQGDWQFATLHRNAVIQSIKFNLIVDKHAEFLSMYDVQTSAPMHGNFQFVMQQEDKSNHVLNISIHNIASQIIPLPLNLPPNPYRITIMEKGQIIYETILNLWKPRLLDFMVNYNPQENQLNINYEIDKHRSQDYYKLKIYDSSSQLIKQFPLDRVHNIRLLPGRYSLEILWDIVSLGIQTLDVVADKTNHIHKDVGTDLLENWILELLEARPVRLDPQQLFSLATLPLWNPKNSVVLLLKKRIEKVDQLWSALGKLVYLQNSQSWMEKHLLPPSWVLLHNTLSAIIDDNHYWLFPERVFDRGATGIGKIALNTPQEGKIYGYVRWIKRTEGGSSLHIFIPPKDLGADSYSEQDELDFYPAYYDSVHKRFHGSRNGGIIPGKQLDGGYIKEVGHTPLMAQIISANRPLIHKYTPKQTFDRLLTRKYLHGEVKITLKADDLMDLMTQVGYFYAVAKSLELYAKNQDSEKRIHHLVGDKFSKQVTNAIQRMTTLAHNIRIPSVIAILEFVREMEHQVDTSLEDPLMALDRNVLILAFAVRVNGIPHTDQMYLIKENLFLPPDLLQSRLYDAYLACPLLLEWALIWAEIFIVGSAKSILRDTP